MSGKKYGIIKMGKVKRHLTLLNRLAGRGDVRLPDRTARTSRRSAPVADIYRISLTGKTMRLVSVCCRFKSDMWFQCVYELKHSTGTVFGCSVHRQGIALYPQITWDTVMRVSSGKYSRLRPINRFKDYAVQPPG
jgi:hypothetical protein